MRNFSPMEEDATPFFFAGRVVVATGSRYRLVSADTHPGTPLAV
jgi:hypothetical protein